jgi:hypothetical protein
VNAATPSKTEFFAAALGSTILQMSPLLPAPASRMTESSNSKTVVRVTVPWVRIPLRQLIHCFCREISPPEILTEDPRVSLTQFDANYHRERSLETADAPLASNSPFGNLAVRLDRGLGSPHVLCAITGIGRNGVPSERLLPLSAI